MKKKKKALLVVDMLNDFLYPKGKLFCGKPSRKIIPFAAKKIEEFRAKNLPVIFICDTHPKNSREFRIYPPHAVKGTWGAEIIPELNPAKADVIVPKDSLDPFVDTPLEKLLKRKKINEVYVLGVCTSICVMEVVSGLVERGFETVVYKKGIADFDKRAHRDAIYRMKKVFKARFE